MWTVLLLRWNNDPFRCCGEPPLPVAGRAGAETYGVRLWGSCRCKTVTAICDALLRYKVLR